MILDEKLPAITVASYSEEEWICLPISPARLSETDERRVDNAYTGQMRQLDAASSEPCVHSFPKQILAFGIAYFSNITLIRGR